MFPFMRPKPFETDRQPNIFLWPKNHLKNNQRAFPNVFCGDGHAAGISNKNNLNFDSFRKNSKIYICLPLHIGRLPGHYWLTADGTFVYL